MKAPSIFLLMTGLTGPLVPVSAVDMDIGGSVFNHSALATTGLDQANVVDLWVEGTWDDNVVFTAQGGAALGYNPASPDEILLAYADVDLVNLRKTWNFEDGPVSLLSLTVGRLMLSEFSTEILSHRADGVFFDVETPLMALNVGAGFTGFLVKKSTSLEVSNADIRDAHSPSVLFAPPRAIGLVQGQWLGWPGQKLFVSLLAQYDLRDRSTLVAAGSRVLDPVGGGPVNTGYAGLGADGSLGGGLYYDAFGYVEAGQLLFWQSPQYTSRIYSAALASGGLHYLVPWFLNSQIGAKGEYASGDPNATSVIEGQTASYSNFQTVSRPVLAAVFSPRLSNLALAEASWSSRPLNFLKTQVSALGFWRPTGGAISEPGIALSNHETLLGTEVDGSASAFFVSDLTITALGGVFLPGPAFGATSKPQTKLAVNLDVVF